MFSLFWFAVTQAAPLTVQHQGRLLDPTGGPFNGELSVTFSIFKNASGTTAADRWWTDTQSLTVSDGYYSTRLGTLDSTWFSDPAWLEIKVGSSVLGPRQQLAESWLRSAGIGVGGLPSSESCSTLGEVVFDTELRTLRVCDGSGWQVAGALVPLDLTPEPVDFVNVVAAAPSSVVTSNTVTVGGYTGSRTATVTPSSATFVVDGTSTGSSVASLLAGQTLAVRATASSSFSTASNFQVTFGPHTDAWSVTTHGPCVAGTQTLTAAGVSSFVVPNGCTHLSVALWGGGGGSSAGSNSSGCAGDGGNGAYVTGIIDVVSDETLTIVVGGPGAGSVYPAGGGGGGHSSVLRGLTSLISAGGGGGGGNGNGTGGGTSTTASPQSGYGGGAGGCNDYPNPACGTAGGTSSFAGGTGQSGGNGGVGGGGGGGTGGNCGGGGGGGGYPGGTNNLNAGGRGGGSVVPSGGTHVQGGAPAAATNVGKGGIAPRSNSYTSTAGTAGRVVLTWAP